MADLRWEFHENYGSGRDFEGSDLIGIVVAAADLIGEIVGHEIADRGMAEIVRCLYSGFEYEDWRRRLEEQGPGDAYSWPETIGPTFHALNAYANYGFVLGDWRTPEERARQIAAWIEEASAFLAKVPFAAWGLPAGDAGHTLRLARGRWALDNDEAVEPYALAEFGGVSERRIRNMMAAGAERRFTNKDGKIPAKEALSWLKDRETFRPSVWREQEAFEDLTPTPPAELDKAFFVPVAQDGSIFHPGLDRDGVYPIGRRGHEVRLPSYEQALAALQRLAEPAWRRPSPRGVWTIVTAVRWERMSAADLNRLAQATR